MTTPLTQPYPSTPPKRTKSRPRSHSTAYPLSSSSSSIISSSSSRYLLPRPSLRLKTSLYLLLLTIALLVLLALNAAHTPPSSLHTTNNNSHLNTSPSKDTPADSGEGLSEAAGQDAGKGEGVEEIQRSFEEPDYGLLSSKQPSRIGCDVPLDGEEGERGVLVFLGIFSTADKRERRDLYVLEFQVYIGGGGN
jgi:hypothetical protein